ncbi:MAG: hypothetical protein EGR33_03080 [Prevotella sp.]|nr:hypothetical protein [Prevotella sp.]
MAANAVPATTASGSRDGRRSAQMRASLGAETGAARSRFAKRHGDWIGGMGRREGDAVPER